MCTNCLSHLENLNKHVAMVFQLSWAFCAHYENFLLHKTKQLIFYSLFHSLFQKFTMKNSTFGFAIYNFLFFICFLLVLLQFDFGGNVKDTKRKMKICQRNLKSWYRNHVACASHFNLKFTNPQFLMQTTSPAVSNEDCWMRQRKVNSDMRYDEAADGSKEKTNFDKLPKTYMHNIS